MSDGKKPPPGSLTGRKTPVGGVRLPLIIEKTRARTEERDKLIAKVPPAHVRAESPRPENFDDPITGSYEGEELARMRSKRPSEQRIAILEGKHDDLSKTVQSMRLLVVEIDTKQDLTLAAMERIEQRQHVKFEADIGVGKAVAIDVIDKRKDKRKALLTILGAVVGGGALLKILQGLL